MLYCYESTLSTFRKSGAKNKSQFIHFNFFCSTFFKSGYYMPSLALTNSEFNTIFKTKTQYETQINNIPKSDGTTNGNADYNKKILAILTVINTDNDKLLDYISKINIDITNAKKINKKFKNDLGEIDSDINGSDELIENYKYLYNRNYIKNISMVIGVIFASMYLVKGFR